MAALSDHVRSYFAACSRGDEQAISAHFAPDAVIYDTNHAPILGAHEIGRFWTSIRRKWDGASWHVDTSVEDGSRLAIEWTMRGKYAGGPITVRGSEHYEFSGGLIQQIRQYWSFDPSDITTELLDYPYAEDERFH